MMRDATSRDATRSSSPGAPAGGLPAADAADAQDASAQAGAGEDLTTVESIAAAYLLAAEGDAGSALRRAIADALADLGEAERRTRRRDRLVSRGYVRSRLADL